MSWTVRDTSGRTRTVQLQPQTVADADWIRPQTEAPLWEQRREEQIWTVYWVDQQTLYVNFRGYENLARNAERLLGELDRLRPAHLVIDLRDNGGGDYEKGRRLLIEPITQRPWINSRGRLFVMVGRRTFSAAMVNAVDFDAMTHALLVGEPIGEKPNSYQEVRQFTLPDSGLTVGVSTKWYASRSRRRDKMRSDPTSLLRQDGTIGCRPVTVPWNGCCRCSGNPSRHRRADLRGKNGGGASDSRGK